MTIETPLHLQRVGFIDERHLVDAAMAGRATDPLVHMNTVVEVHEAGKVVDAIPLDRLAGPEARANRFQHFGIRPDLRMAAHAGVGRRDTGEGAHLDPGVAVGAMNAELSCVMLMAEGNRLLARQSYVGDVSGAVEAHYSEDGSGRKQPGNYDADERYRIRTARENLGHPLLRTELTRVAR